MRKVDIIMPAYNSGKYIANAIESVLAQKYEDLKLYVVDDGSVDDTKLIIETYINKNPGKIAYSFQKNKGPAAARNKGISESNGEYIAFLDSDDIWYPEKLEKQISLFNNKNTGFIYCDNYFVDEQRGIFQSYSRNVKLLSGDILLDLFCDFFIITSSIVLRRECINQVGLFDEMLIVGEDYDFFLRLAKFFKADVVKEKLWERRVLSNSLSRKDFVLDARNDLMILKRFLSNNSDFYHTHKKQINNRLSQYHFSFGYRYLEHGFNRNGFFEFIKSLYYRASLRAIKNLLFCLIPLKIRRLYKKTYAKN